MRRIMLFGLLAVLVPSGAHVHSQETEPVEKIMTLKLGYAHQVLESLIQQDFEAIKELSFRLGVLASSEDWKVIHTPEYSQHTLDFRRAVEAFRKAPNNVDIDAATLAYVEMTLSCVRCHKYVYEYQTASDQEK